VQNLIAIADEKTAAAVFLCLEWGAAGKKKPVSGGLTLK